MNKNHLKAAVIGGLVVFIWGVVSWMVFPWHQHCLKKFSNESEVARALVNNAPEDGMYVLPNTFGFNSSTSQKEMTKAMRMMERGPFMFGVVRPYGIGRMTITPFIGSLILQIVGAYIAIWMLLKTKGLFFREQVAFITLFGLAAGLLGEFPLWIWRGFTLGYVILNVIHMTIGWAIAGYCMVRYLRR